MAIIKACLVSTLIKNTGKECDTAMGPAAMFLAMPKHARFTKTDLETPDSWISTQIHAAKRDRAYPLFGQEAPIRTITNNKENDVLVTLDDGSTVFLRYGFFNRSFETTSGGLCYAKALQSLNKSGYTIVEIDQAGQMLVRDYGNDTYGGLKIDFMYSPSPVLADLKSTPYKNMFQLSYSPTEYVNNGLILAGAESFLSLMGLIDAKTYALGVSTTGYLSIDIETECAETDLVDVFGADWEDVTNFVVTNKATGAVVTLSGVTTVSGALRLAGTFVTGQTYVVNCAAPSVLKTNGIEGYEVTEAVEITI